MAAASKDGPELHPVTVGLAQGRNYGAITTVLPSGRLQTHPIWVDTPLALHGHSLGKPSSPAHCRRAYQPARWCPWGVRRERR